MTLELPGRLLLLTLGLGEQFYLVSPIALLAFTDTRTNDRLLGELSI